MEDDKSEQWMGVSVVSQATDDGKALVSTSCSYLYCSDCIVKVKRLTRPNTLQFSPNKFSKFRRNFTIFGTHYPEGTFY